MLSKEDYARSVRILNSLPAFNVNQPLAARVLYCSINIKDVNCSHLTTKQHNHFFYEMHIPADTDASMNIENKLSVTIPKGGAILLCPGTNHGWENAEKPGVRLSFAFIPDKDSESVLACKEKYSVTASSEVLEFFVDYIAKLNGRDIEKSVSFASFSFSFIMEEVLKSIGNGNAAETKSVPKQNYVERAKQYILTHYTERPTVEKIAENIFISSKQLNRLFREKENMTVGDYVNGIICFEAKRMLAKKELSVSAIAANLGFPSAAAFSNFIKYHFGKTPVQLSESVDLADALTGMTEEYK